MSGFTIVVKGEDGLGRSQVAEILKHALQEKGFTDVSVICAEKTDIHTGTTPFREQPVLIAEG